MHWRENLQNCRSVVIIEMCSFITLYWDACSSDIDQDTQTMNTAALLLCAFDYSGFAACSERTLGHYAPSSSSQILLSPSWFRKIPQPASHPEWQAACLSGCVWFVSLSGCVALFHSMFLPCASWKKTVKMKFFLQGDMNIFLLKCPPLLISIFTPCFIAVNQDIFISITIHFFAFYFSNSI